MKLLLRRAQRAGGLSGNMIFCLDARVEFTPSEREDIRRYRLANQVIYNSEASKRALAKSEAAHDGSTVGGLKAIAFAAMAAMKLNISIASLERGQHIECKSLDELLGAEEAIMSACENLRGYLETAATFDGREVVVDFTTETPTIVAQAPAIPPPMPVLTPLQLSADTGVVSAMVVSEASGSETAPALSAPIRGAAPTGLTQEQVKLILWAAAAALVLLFLLKTCGGH
jgi:hypothetical protein